MFEPSLVHGSVTTLSPFRYWCQKVLPLVYDNSLSYYELLCKVVEYLNETMENVNTIGENTNALYNSYLELVEYVNNYFTNLDVQDEINNKLDAMVENGVLETILNATLFNEYNERLVTVENRGYYVTPQMFGAIADGVSDDTNAVQQAINTGKAVYFPFSNNETYLITENLIVTTAGQSFFSDVEWQSGEVGTRCLLFINDAMIDIKAQHTQWSKIAFTAKDKPVSNYCLYVNNEIAKANGDIHVVGCTFTGFSYAIYNSGRGMLVDSCAFIGCFGGIEQEYTYDGTDGAWTQQPETGDRCLRIVNNRYHGEGFIFHNKAGVLRGMIMSNNVGDIGATLLLNDATMRYCDITGNVTDLLLNNVTITNNGTMEKCLIANNIFSGREDSQCIAFISSASGTTFTNNIITNNLFRKCTRSAMEIDTSMSNMIITNNKFEQINVGNSARRGAIKISQALTDSIISNNTCDIGDSGTGLSGLLVTSNDSIVMSKCFVQGNICNRNVISGYSAGEYNNQIQEDFVAN